MSLIEHNLILENDVNLPVIVVYVRELSETAAQEGTEEGRGNRLELLLVEFKMVLVSLPLLNAEKVTTVSPHPRDYFTVFFSFFNTCTV